MVSLSGEETKNHNKNPLCFELFQPNIYGLKAFFKRFVLDLIYLENSKENHWQQYQCVNILIVPTAYHR